MDWVIAAVLFGGVLIVLFGAYLLLVYKRQHHPDHLTFRDIAMVAKTALLNKEAPPEIFRRLKDHSEIPFDALAENKKKAVIPGTYHFRWPKLQLGYTNKDLDEKIVIQVEGDDKVVTTFFTDGAVNGIRIGKENLDMEDFEMRHAGTISDQLRSFIRYYLRFPEGSLTIDKAPEPTFKPVLDLKKKGEIHLHGKAPPERMPNFQDNDE